MKKVVSLISMILFFGCTDNSDLSPAAYVRFMESKDNGYNRIVKSGSIEYGIQLATPEYMAIKGVDSRVQMDTADLNPRLRELQDHIFFLVRIYKPLEKSVASEMVTKFGAESMVSYYGSTASQDMSIKIDGRERKPATYMFENNYALAPYNTIVVGFEAQRTDGDIEFVFSDRYFNQPYIKTKFSKKELAAIPALTIN